MTATIYVTINSRKQKYYNLSILQNIKVVYFSTKYTLIFTEARLESSLCFLFSADLFSLEADGGVFFTFLPLLSTSSPSPLLPSMSTTKQNEHITQYSRHL